MMSDTRGRVEPIIQVQAKHIARAVAQVREALDRADYSSPVYMGARLGDDLTLPEMATAWMMAAIAIADLAEVDSMTLRSLQNRIWRGEQDALFW